MPERINIVGIGGVGRSGKDTLANMFMEKRYFGVSFGDITRDFALVRHANDPHPISRANLTETSNWLRETRGPGVIMDIAMKRFQTANKDNKYKGLVSWSIRAPIEADFILSHGGALIWIDVSDQVRYKRAMNHLRPGEPRLSFDDYLAQENTQYKPHPGIPREIQMNLPYIRSKATKILENNSDSIDEFKKRAINLINSL